MKIRIQVNEGDGWRDGCEREVTERGERSVRADDPEGYTRTFSLVDGSIWYSGARLRIHPDDVPGLMSLPVRGENPKPLDLNKHPAADMLREVVQDAATISVGDEGVEGIVSEIVDEGYAIGLECKEVDHLKRIAALAIVGLVAIRKTEGNEG